MLISKFISQPGKQTLATQTIKLGQLIIYSIKNIFLGKSYTTQNVVEKLFPNPFLKTKMSISLDQ